MSRPPTTTSAAGGTRWLLEALGLPEGDTPFPWQKELLRRFVNETIDRSLDIPTGLGKTAVMAIWLVARAHGAAMPRRLVYVVDRRAVVDQATEVAESLRNCVERHAELKHALGLGSRLLPISTLRGQHVDNKEWLEDPGCPAIIVGTVDMIGSRLLFEGYGTSRKMRPYQAGLLGADTLVVLDEAHLVPPFEKLLEAVADGHSTFGPRGDILRKLVPPFKLLALSATGRTVAGKKYGLQAADLEHPIVRKRLDAPKRLTLLPPLDKETKLSDALAEQAWRVSTNGSVAVRCIVFCDRRKVAEKTLAVIKELSNGDKKNGIPKVEVDTELFVGGRRVFEREEAAEWLRSRGFIAGTQVERTRPAFVIATSAGEVGVDLDADHMVSDLVAWERMVQRLGRVNRRGEGEAEIIVVDEQLSKDAQNAQEKVPDDRNAKERLAVADAERKNAVRQLFKLLPEKEGVRDASPGALRALKLSGEADAKLQAILDTATTPVPLRPALSRPLVDAWSMTSLKEHTGRPEIDPWLHGWVADDPPQTVVVWRTHLPIRTEGSAAKKKEIEAFFEAAPPHVSETLETESFRVVEWLSDRANDLLAPKKDETSTTDDSGNDEGTPLRMNDVIGFALTYANDLRANLRLDDLAAGNKDKVAIKKSKADLERKLAGATLVVDARIGGLLREGLLDPSAKYLPCTADHGDEWMEETMGPVVGFRVLSVDANWFPGVDRAQWRERLRFATELSDDGEPARWLLVQKWRDDAATENDRAVGRPQLLNEHEAWTEERARSLARRLSLPDEYVEMLATAARLHDEGKQAKRWQRAFNAKSDGVYAKTRGPLNNALLDGYRHEFGSLPFAAKDSRLRKLPDDLKDLALHLIAAHHGFARPVISTEGCEDAPPSALEDRAREIALRFARLQKRWGPWGLAWWEALLRSADQQASRDNDLADANKAKEKSDG